MVKLLLEHVVDYDPTFCILKNLNLKPNHANKSEIVMSDKQNGVLLVFAFKTYQASIGELRFWLKSRQRYQFSSVDI